MKRIFPAIIATVLLGSFASLSQSAVFELRTYTTNEGKLDNLNARFRDHTVRLFKKHGIESVGYWVPTDEKKSKNTLIYVIRHESREAAKASWRAFGSDPAWKNGNADEDDVFELRIYKAAPGKLGKLDARFHDHTIRLFDKYGMKSVAYWHPTDEPQSSDTLIYIIKHDSREAAGKSWKAFLADADWKKAAQASGVGRLAEAPDSIYMKATDYSAIR